jgi:hypothetical protein
MALIIIYDYQLYFSYLEKMEHPLYDKETQRANLFSFVKNVSRTVKKERPVKSCCDYHI